MTASVEPAVAGHMLWTCPFCLLLSDTGRVQPSADGSRLEMSGHDCAPARRLLPHFAPTPAEPQAFVDGAPVAMADAMAAAARMLRSSIQPLVGGLGTDVAGARALYRLASATGAIADAAAGRALMHGLRALQDRGGFTTTLAEVRTRADAVVCLGGLPTAQASDLFERAGFGTEFVERRLLAVVGAGEGDDAALAALAALPHVEVMRLPLVGDVHASAALLTALAAGRHVVAPPPAYVDLVQRLRASTYVVIAGATASLPAHGSLLIEAANRLVGELNRTTRAAAFWLGGGNGASTVNQVFAWLSGLPLRSRAGPAGLEHEPECFDAARLVADRAVDALVWVSSFDPESMPPASDLPLLVLGHPALARAAARPGAVFIPVSTPGIGSTGHLFRTDGVMLMPLQRVYEDRLPTLADVVGRLTLALVEPSL